MGLEDIDDDLLPPPPKHTAKAADLSDIFGDLGVAQRTVTLQQAPQARAAPSAPADALAGFFSSTTDEAARKPVTPPPTASNHGQPAFDSLFEFGSTAEKKKHVDIKNESEKYFEAWASGGGMRKAEPTLGQMKAPSTAAVTAQLLALMNYYDVLGVDGKASVDDIRRSYKKKALELHPDKVGRQQTAEEAQLFKTITKAHDVLTDPAQRAEYDASLVAEQTQTSWFSHLGPPAQ
jgi:hypothetical protein